MKTQSVFATILLLAALAASGCATGRRTIALTAPTPAGATAIARGSATIATISDNRVFQNNPRDPSVPSIDGDSDALTPNQKGQMIGRQRGSFGKAFGDIALPVGDSVPEQVRRLLKAGLKARGYDLTDAPSAQTSLDVSIDQVWAWVSPGFWSLPFEARIQCAITLTKAGKTAKITIQGYGSNPGQTGRSGNWKKAYDLAYANFLANLQSQLEDAGF
jgi:uncharacterized lipoprotein YajG